MAPESGKQIDPALSVGLAVVPEPPLTVVVDNESQARWSQDRALVKAACQGAAAQRHQAYAQLVERYQTFLRNMLYGLCRDQDLADELAQESFVLAWQKLSTLRDGEKFQGWLKQLAYRQFLHQQRHQNVVARHQQSLAADAKAGELGVIDAGHLGEDWVKLLKPCTALEQELMVLLFGFEFSYAEIAQARQMPVGTVKSHIHRAKAKIAALLQEE